ncbi:MAG: hypothetical protein HOY71_52210, partial [Nonomuraea sp.]|nr:hypothetical protein [Nonomuraea sp.]
MGFDGFAVPDFAKPYIGWVVGMDWPEGDETGCFRLADACITAAHKLVAGTGADQPESADKIGIDWDGDAHLAFAAHVNRKLGGQLGLAVKRLVDAAVALNGIGVQIQYTKYMIEITVWLLVLQLAYLLGAALLSGGASLAIIPSRLQIARMTVRQIVRQCLRNMAMFAAIVGGMDLGIQQLQKLQGRRDEIDLEQLTISAVSGGVMGGFMGVFAGGLTRLATPALRAGLTRAEMSAAEKLLAAARNSLYGQATQFAAAGGLTTAATMKAQGNFEWDMLLKGITSSALGADGQHFAAPKPTTGEAAPGPHIPERAPYEPDPVAGGDTRLSAMMHNDEAVRTGDWTTTQPVPEEWKNAPAHQQENAAQPTNTAAVRPDGPAAWKSFDVYADQPKGPIHPPRAVEIGALGETAVHDVTVPSNPRTAAQTLTDGLTGVTPRERAAVRHWLTDVLANRDREAWTGHLQRGVSLGVGDKLIYV